MVERYPSDPIDDIAWLLVSTRGMHGLSPEPAERVTRLCGCAPRLARCANDDSAHSPSHARFTIRLRK